MAQPAYDPRQPLLNVLALNKMTIAEMNQMLNDGADEIDRVLPKLIEKHTTSGSVKAAQLALVRKELRGLQSALWGDLGRSTRSGVEAAATTASATAEGALWQFLAKHGLDMPQLRAANVATARQGIAAMLAKSANGIPLARSVYHTQQLASGMVDRKVSQGLLLGNNAKAIAKSVSTMIRPNVAGGVSYAAHRLARTEINHAYKTAQEQRYANDPWVKGMRWNLSKTHPKPDQCNEFADADDHGLGDGVYPVGHRPRSHPNCLCYLTAESISEEEFEDAFMAGEYNRHIDSQIYGSVTPVAGRPCP